MASLSHYGRRLESSPQGMDYIYEVRTISEKSLVHSSFKIKIRVLQKLFTKEHPAQGRHSEMENQLNVILFSSIAISIIIKIHFQIKI